MAITVERLRVVVESDGDRSVSRGLRRVGRSALKSAVGVGRLGEQLQDLSRELRQAAGVTHVLSNRQDRLSRNFRETGMAASMAAVGISAYSASAVNAYALTKALGITMQLALIPAIIMLGAVLTSLTSILLGVAGAGFMVLSSLSAIIGSGYFLWGSKLLDQNQSKIDALEAERQALLDIRRAGTKLTVAQAQRLRDINEEIFYLKRKNTVMAQLKEAHKEVGAALKRNAKELGANFLPMLKRARDLMPQLIDNIFAAIGPTDAFEEALIKLGNAAFRNLPKIVGWMFEIGREALPEFMRFVAYIGEKGPNAVKRIREALNGAYEATKKFTRIFVEDLLPALNTLGTVALPMLLGFLGAVAGAIRDVSVWMANLPPGIRRVVVAISMFTAGLVLLERWVVKVWKHMQRFQSFLTLVWKSAFWGAIVPITALAVALEAFRQNLFGFRDAVQRVMAAISREWNATFALLKHVVMNVLGTFADEWGITERSVKQSVRNIINIVANTLVVRIEQAGNAIRNVLMRANAWWNEHGVTVVRRIEELATTVREKFRQIRDHIRNGMSDSEKAIGALSAALFLLTGSGILTNLAVLIGKVALGVGLMSKKMKVAKGPAKGLWKIITKVGAVFLTLFGFIGRFITKLGLLSGKIAAVVLSKKKLVALLRGKLRGAFLAARAVVITLGKGLLTLATYVLPLVGKLKGLSLASFSLRGAFVRLAGFIPRLLLLVRGLGIAVAGVAGPIGVAILIVGLLYEAWKRDFGGIKTVTMDVLGAVKDALNGDTTRMKEIVGNAAEKIRNVWKNDIEPMVKDTERAIDKVTDAIENGLKWLHENAVKPALDGILELWRLHGDDIWMEISQLWDEKIKPFIGGVFEFLKRLFKRSTEKLTSFWEKHGDTILTVTKFIFDTIGSVIGGVLDFVLTLTKVTLALINGEYDRAWNYIKNFTMRIFNGIKDFFVKWGGKLLDWLGGLVGDFIGWFEDMAKDAVGEVTGLTDDAYTAFVTFGTDTIKWLGGFIGDFLSDTKQFGTDLIHGGASVIKKIVSAIELAFSTMKANIVGKDGIIANLASDMKTMFKNLGDAIAGKFKNAFNAAMPDSLSFDGFTINNPKPGGEDWTVSGFSFNLPSLDTGGFIEEDGLAMVHKGEQVLNPAEVDKRKRPPGEGSGESVVVNGDINVYPAEGREGEDVLAELRSQGFNT